jgi:catechol 2,3-dioxygenase-like lactoylglutathione lyase family enzyme
MWPMSHETTKAGLRSATPVFLVSDIAATFRWYEDNLGFEADPFPEAPPHTFCILRRDNVEIMLQQLARYSKPDHYADRPGGVWNVYLRVNGVRELFAAIGQRAGVNVLKPLHHQPYGQTEFEIRDPNGYTLVFAEAL